MNIKTQSFASITKIILDVLFVLGCLSLAVLPFLRNTPFDIYRYISSDYTVFTVHSTIYVFNITVVYVLYELKKIYKTIKEGTPFNTSNIKSLYRMGLASFSLGILMFIKLFVFRTLLTYIMIVILIIAGCFSWTLSALFREAKKVKDENDLTI